MSIRTLLTISVFLLVFLGLISMVGNVHVAEFYGILGFATIAAIISWFKIGRLDVSKKKLSKTDFQ